MLNAQVEPVERTPVAFAKMSGAYAQMGLGFGAMYGWLAEKGLTPQGMPRAAFLTDPATTPEDEALWELQTPLAGTPSDSDADESGHGVRYLDPHLEAWALHRGPYDSMEPTYDALVEWIADQGYEVSGPPMEVYLSSPSDTAPADYLTEVRFPVRRK